MTTAPDPARPVLPPVRMHRAAGPGLTSLRTVTALVLREMSTTYGKSAGGYLWAILEPVAGIALLSLVFSLVMRNPAIGNNFTLFYATGVMPFTIFSGSVNKLAQALNFSRQLLAYPTVTYIDAILARFFLYMLTEIMVWGVVLVGILVLFDTRVIPDPEIIAGAMLLSGFLGLGVGTLNCYLTTQFPLWQQIWGVLMRPMLILSCVMFVFDSIPHPFRDWLWFNPVVHLVGLTRHGFYTGYDAPYVSVAYVMAISAVCFVIGLVLLHRNYRLLMQR
jgi:capsular polysaccharide transport system permease protein